MLIGMSEQMTTIKVPKSLRQRIAREAARDGSTAAALLSRLLDDHDRQARFEAVRAAYAEVTSDALYEDELRLWDVTVGDGLDDEAAPS